MKTKLQVSRAAQSSEESKPATFSKGRPPANSHLLTFPRSHFLLLLALILSTAATRAVIPEPDNVFYGTIAFTNAPVTASNTDIVIEARRALAGAPIASYRMGDDPRVGNFYSLRVGLESVPPVTKTNAMQTGEALFIFVKNDTRDLAQTNVTVGARGQFFRLDFGAVSTDVDGDGLPDAWELAFFGNLGQNGNGDPDGDGRSHLAEYLAGSNPALADSGLFLDIAQSNGQIIVSFFGRRAQGPGYEGRFRYYDLQSSTNLADGLWFGVPGYTNLLGNNLTIIYQTPVTTSPQFFRARVSLQGP